MPPSIAPDGRWSRPSQLSIVLAFLSVYFCWGATYTAMSVGVQQMPAAILAGVRMLAGAALMLAFCALRGRRIFWDRRVMARLMLLGLMLLFGGNLALTWSEKYLASGLAALIVAVVPLYVVLIEMLIPGGDRLRRQGYIGLGLGSAALVALLWPSLRSSFSGHPLQLIAMILVLAGAFSWAAGSVTSRRMNLPVDPLVAAGWEMFAAGVADVLFATAFRQWPHAVWNWRTVGSIAYLVTFGSLLGFSSYIWLIAHVPVAKVSTYAYVNPVVAVILGAVILGERLAPTEYIGMIGVVLAVVLVTSSRLKTGQAAAEVECVAVESEA
jgi:drug/metabolite transporter (DMT)-like permease